MHCLYIQTCVSIYDIAKTYAKCDINMNSKSTVTVIKYSFSDKKDNCRFFILSSLISPSEHQKQHFHD